MEMSKENLVFGAESSIFSMVDSGGRRNEDPLTRRQKREARDYALSLGVPREAIQFDPKAPTNYSFGALTIGRDVAPLKRRSKKPNSNISIRGGIAHEIVGHREAELKGRTQPTYAEEEAQASIRAARFAPGLSRGERMDLIRDGLNRLHNAGISLRDVKAELFLNERF